MKEHLYELDLDKRIKVAKDWERIKKKSDKAWKEADVASTPAERFERYPPTNVRHALAIHDAEPYEWTGEELPDYLLLFLPMFVAMFILYVACSM